MSIFIKYNKVIKKFKIKKSYKVKDLINLISSYFELHQRIIGVSDKQGNFYQLDWIIQNQNFLKNQTYSLLLDNKVETQSQLSFGTQREVKSQSSVIQHFQQIQKANQNHKQKRLLGTIINLQVFEKILLNQNKISIVFIGSHIYEPNPEPDEYFFCTGNQPAFIIYYGIKRVFQGNHFSWPVIYDRLKKLTLQGSQFQNEEEISNYSFDPNSKQKLTSFLKKLNQKHIIQELDYLILLQKANKSIRNFCIQFNIQEQQLLNRESNFDDFANQITIALQEKKQIKQSNSKNFLKKTKSELVLPLEQQLQIDLLAEKGFLKQDQLKIICKALLDQNNNILIKLFEKFSNKQLTEADLSFNLKQQIKKGIKESYHLQRCKNILQLINEPKIAQKLLQLSMLKNQELIQLMSRQNETKEQFVKELTILGQKYNLESVPDFGYKQQILKY